MYVNSLGGGYYVHHTDTMQLGKYKCLVIDLFWYTPNGGQPAALLGDMFSAKRERMILVRVSHTLIFEQCFSKTSERDIEHIKLHMLHG